MQIRVITSCTGEKSVSSPDQLALEDFRQGDAHVRAREAVLGDIRSPAEDLYTGLQHQRLMRGIRAAREETSIEVDLRILSAGYGLVSADQKLAPYEATFTPSVSSPDQLALEDFRQGDAHVRAREAVLGDIYVLQPKTFTQVCSISV
jgi:cytoplasmic iron level regulating protein YaaA (DUF328/UPF0246 family)